ncbi:MAG: fused MFS/spermidine synthase [Planctomycetota bacterium]
MSAPRTAAIAALEGFAVLTVELAAVRLFAPHFGDSAFVWTNVIGVLLVALAVGAFLGARLARRGTELRSLSWLLVAAALAVAVVPWIARELGVILVPDDLPLENATGILVVGSLAATTLVFALPITLAGAVTPLLVSAAVVRGQPAGTASGLVAGFGTLGSLVGTFATTHVLVPELGSARTIHLAALALAVAALLTRTRGRAAVAAVVVVGAAIAVPRGAIDPPNGGAVVRAEVESRYQFLQVQRLGASDFEPAKTVLRINEGLDSFHSIAFDDEAWTKGRYYDWFPPLALLTGNGGSPGRMRVLSLGGAAGTFDRLFRAEFSGAHVHSVEIDPAAVQIGREHFSSYRAADAVTAGMDARVFVNHDRGPWDLVLVDAYERQVYIPAHLASVEFFREVHRILGDQGVVALNCGGVRNDDPVLTAVAGTMACVFGQSFSFRVPQSRNFVVLAKKGSDFDPSALASPSSGSSELRAMALRMSNPVQWTAWEPAPEPLVDDRPLLDALFHRSFTAVAPTPIQCRGTVASSEAERRAQECAGLGDHEGVLDAVASSSDATAYLRLLAGDARWSLHEPRAAESEYGAAVALRPASELDQLLQARRRGLAPLLEQMNRVDAAAERSAWWAMGSLVGFAALVWIAFRRA